MKKRYISIILTVIMSLSLMTACSGKSDSAPVTSEAAIQDSVEEVVDAETTPAEDEINEVTEEPTPTEAIAEDETSSEVNNDEMFEFTLLGENYKIPCATSEFTNNGWSLKTSNKVTEDSVLDGEDDDWYTFVNGDAQVKLELYNTSGSQKKIMDCYVGGVHFNKSYSSDASDFVIKDGVTVDFTPEEVIATLGEPTEYRTPEDSTFKTNPNYSLKYVFNVKYSGGNGYFSNIKILSYVEDAKQNYIELVNMVPVKDISDNAVPSDAPEYLSQYKDPKVDTKHGIQPEAYITLDGDTYCFPCPVSEFTNNGWSIESKESSIASNGDTQVIISKNGEYHNLVLKNYDTNKQAIENCAATYIITSDPGKFDLYGIKIGTTEADALSIMNTSNSEWSKYESDYATSYRTSIVREDGKKIFLSVMIKLETKEVCRIDVSSDTWIYGD